MFQLLMITGICMCMSGSQGFSQALEIVTIDSPLQYILKQKTEDILEDELAVALDIGDKLLQALKPYAPAAGLAAPQIGINRSVFIYSYNRDFDQMELVINPTFKPVGDSIIKSWEGCFSVILSENVWKLAKVPRFEKIHVSYMDREGHTQERILEGFAAKVFQHEYDHLQGIENIDRADAEIKDFATRDELWAFMQKVKQEDSNHYKQ